ncbi:MAG: PepSY-associated TM helix domain-containing protein [Pseudomonadota bacterium]
MADTERVSMTTVAEQPKPKKKKTAKRKLYDLHTWLGFHLALIMSVVLFTGTVATISNEIDWIFQHDMRVSPDGERVSWSTIEAAAKAYAPDHMLTRLEVGKGEHFAYRASFTRPDGKRYFVHVNQWTGDVTGTTGALTVQRFFRDLHRYLFMPSMPGIIIVCSMAFVLAVSLYTGLKTTGKIRKVATRLRREKGTRVFVGDLHKAAGVWSVWFFVVIITTGIWYLAEFGAAVGGARFEPPRPGVSAERVAEYGDVMRVMPADEIIAKATDAFPGWEPKEIFYPSRPGQALSVWGRADDVLVRSRANRVFMDPVDGTMIKVQKSGDIGWVAYLNEIADPLHFGTFGRLPTKLIWFVFGVAMTGLSITGVWLTYRRLKKVSVSKSQFATMPVLLLSLLAGTSYINRYTLTYDPGELEQSRVEQIDEFTLSTHWYLHEENGENHIQIDVRHADGRPLIESANLVGFDDQPHAMSFRTFAQTTTLRTTVSSDILSKEDTVFVNVQLASGRQLVQTIGPLNR